MPSTLSLFISLSAPVKSKMFVSFSAVMERCSWISVLASILSRTFSAYSSSWKPHLAASSCYMWCTASSALYWIWRMYDWASSNYWVIINSEPSVSPSLFAATKVLRFQIGLHTPWKQLWCNTFVLFFSLKQSTFNFFHGLHRQPSLA